MMYFTTILTLYLTMPTMLKWPNFIDKEIFCMSHGTENVNHLCVVPQTMISWEQYFSNNDIDVNLSLSTVWKSLNILYLGSNKERNKIWYCTTKKNIVYDWKLMIIIFSPESNNEAGNASVSSHVSILWCVIL